MTVARMLTRKSAGLVVLAVVLAGCGNDGDSVDFSGDNSTMVNTPAPDAAELATPTARESPQRSGEAEAARPVPPASMGQRSRGAALDFAHYLVDVLNHARATGDVEPLHSISASGCEGCQGMVDDLRLIYGQGGFSQGGAWRVLSSNAVADVRGTWKVSLTVHAGRQRVKRSADSQVEFVAGGRRSVGVAVTHTEDGWLVANMAVS